MNGGEPDPGEREARELLDRDHPRASVHDGGRFVVAPGKVLDNIELAMERVDVDIDTSISIEEDVASFDEIQSMVQAFRQGPLLAVHVVNTAMRIMSARYPAELVGRPLPPGYDLRKIIAIDVADRQHEIATAIFNRRTVSPVDLAVEDVAADLEPLDDGEQITVFVALFYMYGTKVGAMKRHTGIE
jgi:hypothetical protein